MSFILSNSQKSDIISGLTNVSNRILTINKLDYLLSANMPDSIISIAVIGAGPIGLVLAHQLHDLYGKNATITIFEKNETYTRKQIIMIDKKILELLPECSKKEMELCGILPPSKDNLSRCYEDTKDLSVSIRTSELEKSLSNCLDKSIRNLRPVKLLDHNDKTLTYEYKSQIQSQRFDIIIGADGSKSFVREKILNASLYNIVESDSYGAVFNFDIGDSSDGIFKDVTKEHVEKISKKHAQNDYRFFRGRGIYYIGIEVSKDDADSINNGVIPDHITKELEHICLSVSPIGKGCDFTKLSNMSAFRIKIKRSSRFCDGNGVFLVGDAAMTTHYFTGKGFNVGVKTVISLINYLQRYGAVGPKKEYNDAMMHAVNEIHKANSSQGSFKASSSNYSKIY